MPERVWDRFLSEQDKAHVSGKPPLRMGFGERPALLLVDLYRGVFGDKPEPLLEAVKTWPTSCGLAGWQALPAIQSLLATAREVGIPVVHVADLHEDISGVIGWHKSYRSNRPSRELSPDEEDRRRRRYDIMDEVAPIHGEAVLRKSAPSAFHGTPLAQHLNALQVDTVVVAGESTSGCVRASVVDGCTFRYRMMVVEECVFDRHEATHAINLFDMDQKYADVVSLEEVHADLQQ